MFLPLPGHLLDRNLSTIKKQKDISISYVYASISFTNLLVLKNFPF